MTSFTPNAKDPSKLRRIKTYVAGTSSAGSSTEDVRISFQGPKVPSGVPTGAAAGAEGAALAKPRVFPQGFRDAGIGTDYDPQEALDAAAKEDTVSFAIQARATDARLTAERAARVDEELAARAGGIRSLMSGLTESALDTGISALDAQLAIRPKPYNRIKESNDLLGGWQDFLGNSAPRGVFANYAGTTRKFNSHPQTTQTMARLAIPISGNPYDFITKSGLGATLGPLANSIIIQGNSGLGYIDFLLQNIQESFSEKVQVSDTIGDNYAAFFFGMSPPTFSFAGQFLNTYQDDWRAAFHLLYRNLLRGTMLARRNLILSLYYDNIIITGYMLNHNQQYTAEMQMASNFSFNMLVKNMTIFRLPGTMPSQADRLPADVSFKTFAGVQRAAIQRTSRTVNVVATETLPVKGGECNKDVGSGYSAYGFGSTEDARYLKSEKDEAPSQPGLRSASDPSVAIDIANDVYNESAVANMFSDWQNPIQGIPAPSI
jgi:hypothetical protein